MFNIIALFHYSPSLIKVRQKKSWISEQSIGTIVFLAIFGLAIVAITIYMGRIINSCDKKIIHLNFIAILLGLVFEYKRLTVKWSTVIWTAIASYLLSFIVLGKYKHERVYVFEQHLEMWPYFFLVIFTTIATIIEYTRATKKMTEGITLLLTISINYWLLSNNYWHTGSILIKIFIAINVFLSLFSLFNALTYYNLSKGVRLILSIWSSIITFILAIDNFLKLYPNKDIENLPSFTYSALYFFQFFLLGISSIYIAQNISMIIAYIPTQNYFDTFIQTNETHIKRYSKEQVHTLDSIIITCLCLILFTLNYIFKFLPVNFIIWATLTMIPLLLYFIRRI